MAPSKSNFASDVGRYGRLADESRSPAQRVVPCALPAERCLVGPFDDPLVQLVGQVDADIGGCDRLRRTIDDLGVRSHRVDEDDVTLLSHCHNFQSAA